jgi:SAM-dependent methyltransferase
MALMPRAYDGAKIPHREVRLCPACGSADYFSTGPEAAEFSFESGNETFWQTRYCVRECANCGLLYRDRTLSASDLDRYYANVDFHKWETTGYWPTERRVLESLRSLPHGSRILDFGCSSGRLLAELCGDYQCYGFEINAAAAKEAATKGLRMLTCDQLKDPELEKFDAIVLIDVIEHVVAPLDLLRELLQKIAGRGLLIVSTGYGDAAVCRRDPAQFWYFRNLEHLSMWTRRHVDFVVSALGLGIESWTELCHYPHSVRQKLVPMLRNFAYWQFRHSTFLANNVLQFIPRVRRARNWSSPHQYIYSRDHVVIAFRKLKVQSPGLPWSVITQTAAIALETCLT